MTDAPGCAERRLLVQADHDGELDAGQAASLAAHVESCADCARLAAEFADLSGALRDAGLARAAPESLRRRVRPVVAPPARIRRREAFGFVAGLATAASAAWLLLPGPVQDEVGQAAVTAHVRALQPGHLMDVVSTDQHTVKPWFEGRLDYAPPVRDFAGDGFPLVGARLDYIGRRPIAALVYRRAQHVIDVFVWPRAAERPNLGALSVSGFAVVRWQRDGMVFCAVSDLNPGDLGRFAALWQA